jgi:hypothetical protein
MREKIIQYGFYICTISVFVFHYLIMRYYKARLAVGELRVLAGFGKSIDVKINFTDYP